MPASISNSNVISAWRPCNVQGTKKSVKFIPVHIPPNPFFLNYDSPIIKQNMSKTS